MVIIVTYDVYNYVVNDVWIINKILQVGRKYYSLFG